MDETPARRWTSLPPPGFPVCLLAMSGTHALPGRTSEFRYRRFRVQVTTGPDAGKMAVCDGPEFSVGTSGANDLVLTDPTVSAHHFVIRATPDGYVLSDLDSTNGTMLAGFRVTGAYLRA